MSSQAFLWLNLGFAAVMGLLFYLGRARIKDPTRLRLRGPFRFGNGRDLVPKGLFSLSPEAAEAMARESSGSSHMKSLNVIFMYNGHSWDAYEVLGVPAGANVEMVRAAYAEALKRNKSTSREFIETAYRAIIDRAS